MSDRKLAMLAFVDCFMDELPDSRKYDYWLPAPGSVVDAVASALGITFDAEGKAQLRQPVHGEAHPLADLILNAVVAGWTAYERGLAAKLGVDVNRRPLIRKADD